MKSHLPPQFRGHARRGVLLILVLAILAMFGLIGFTFIMMTSHARRGAQAFARMEETDQNPDELLHHAALQVLRGPNTRGSMMGPHSLLEDLYGNGVTEGTTTGAIMAAAGGQLINVTVQPPVTTNIHRFPGRVLTMLNGPAEGMSFRIVDFVGANILQLANEDGRFVRPGRPQRSDRFRHQRRAV